MDIKGFKSRDGSKHQYDYNALANKPDVVSGKDGGYYTPAVTQLDEKTVQFDFTPSKEGMPAVESVTVELPVGEDSGENAPYIGANGNWHVGDTDTGVAAQGPQGEPGTDGVNGATVVIPEGMESPIVEPDEEGLFPVEPGVWYFAELSAPSPGGNWNAPEFNVQLYDASRVSVGTGKLYPINSAMFPFDLGGHGIGVLGNLNNRVDGNRIAKIRVDNASVAYMRIELLFPATPLRGVYRGFVPQSELDNMAVYNTWLSESAAAAFERRMSSYSGRYKRFRGVYRRELDGDIYETAHVVYGAAAYNKHDEATHTYEYYNGSAGDYWIYLYDAPTTLDNSVAYKGCIVRFDGTLLVAETNPFWSESNGCHRDHYDIAIVGGGSAGFAAAYALRDSGLRVCVIERESDLGGTNLNAGVIHQIASPVGDWYKNLIRDNMANGTARWTNPNSEPPRYKIPSADTSETEFDHIWRGSMMCYSASDKMNLLALNPYAFRRVYHDAIADSVDVLYHRRVVGATMADGRVVSALIERDGGSEVISAEYWIDASGDLALLRSVTEEGEGYFVGADGADRYGESAYVVTDPIRTEINTVEQCYMRCTSGKNRANNGRTTRYVEDMAQYPTDPAVTSGNNFTQYVGFQELSDSDGSYFIVVSPGRNAALDGAALVELGYDHVRGTGIRRAMAHFRKSGKLVWAGPCQMLAIRESYRANSEHMLTQADLEHRITSSELSDKHIVALSSWYCDIHNAASVNAGRVANAWLNGIPYEALIPAACNNVLVAGRCVGSHVAQAGFRLTRTCLSMGYAAGCAALLARKEWLDDVRTVDIAALQEMVGVADTLQDIEDNILAVGVLLDKNELTLSSTATSKLTATILIPNNAESVVWASSNESAATVADGVVTPVANGATTITATVGGFTAECAVTVSISE